MKSEIVVTDLNSINKQKVKIPSRIRLFNYKYKFDKNFQPGGETYAWMYIKSFQKSRHIGYTKNISRPNESRVSCSRLSPYITYGNLSSKQVYQFFNKTSKSRDIRNFCQDFSGDAILCKNLTMSLQWSLKISIEHTIH